MKALMSYMVIVADHVDTAKDIGLVDAVFVTDGEGLLVSTHFVANPDDQCFLFSRIIG